MNQVNHISKAGSQRHSDGLERSPGQFSLVREGWKILEHWMLLTQMAGSGRVLKWESLACWGPRGMCRTLGSGEGRKFEMQLNCMLYPCAVRAQQKQEWEAKAWEWFYPPTILCMRPGESLKWEVEVLGPPPSPSVSVFPTCHPTCQRFLPAISKINTIYLNSVEEKSCFGLRGEQCPMWSSLRHLLE